MSPARALFSVQSRIFSGAEVNIAALLNTIDLKAIEPYLCFNVGSGLEQYVPPDVHLLPMSLPVPRKTKIFSVAAHMARLLMFFQKEHIELVYINAGSGHELRFFSPLCRLLKVPIILHLHIHEEDDSLRWIRAHRASRLIFPSRATMEAVLSTSPWLDQAKCFYVHNGIDVSKYRPHRTTALRKKLDLNNALPVIGIFGQLKEVKGQHLFLKMAKNMLDQGIMANYLVVGKDTTGKGYDRQLRQMAANLGIGHTVHFLGFRTNIPELMSLCDLVVVPSLREPFGRVVIEAMACGTPVVASRVGGIVEIFEDGNGGLFCKPDDVEDLTSKVKYFFDNPAWWEEQKIKAREISTERFRQEIHTRKIERHILELLNQQR